MIWAKKRATVCAIASAWGAYTFSDCRQRLQRVGIDQCRARGASDSPRMR
jgi:hypothetical protein